MRVASHSSGWWDWCAPEDEKKETKKLWAQAWTFLYLMIEYKNTFFLPQKEL